MFDFAPVIKAFFYFIAAVISAGFVIKLCISIKNYKKLKSVTQSNVNNVVQKNINAVGGDIVGRDKVEKNYD